MDSARFRCCEQAICDSGTCGLELVAGTLAWTPFGASALGARRRSVRTGSAADVGTGPGEVDPQDDPAVAYHRRPVVVPVGVLAGDPPVVVDEDVHRVGQRDDLCLALDLDPFAEEAVVDDAERRPGVTPQVLGLDRGLTGTDQHPPLLVDRAEH